MAYGRAGIGRRVLAAALVTGLQAAAAGAQGRSNGELQVGAWLVPGAFEAGVTGWVTDSVGLTARGVFRPPAAPGGNLRWATAMISFRRTWENGFECNLGLGVFQTRHVGGFYSAGQETVHSDVYVELLVGRRLSGRFGVKAGFGVPLVVVDADHGFGIAPKVLGVVLF